MNLAQQYDNMSASVYGSICLYFILFSVTHHQQLCNITYISRSALTGGKEAGVKFHPEEKTQ